MTCRPRRKQCFQGYSWSGAAAKIIIEYRFIYLPLVKQQCQDSAKGVAVQPHRATNQTLRLGPSSASSAVCVRSYWTMRWERRVMVLQPQPRDGQCRATEQPPLEVASMWVMRVRSHRHTRRASLVARLLHHGVRSVTWHGTAPRSASGLTGSTTSLHAAGISERYVRAARIPRRRNRAMCST